MSVIEDDEEDFEDFEAPSYPPGSAYYVRVGQSMTAVSIEVYGDPDLVWLLLQHNDLRDPRKLRTGQKLTIPAADTPPPVRAPRHMPKPPPIGTQGI